MIIVNTQAAGIVRITIGGSAVFLLTKRAADKKIIRPGMKGGSVMRRRIKTLAIALAAAMMMQSFGAPLAYAAEVNGELATPAVEDVSEGESGDDTEKEPSENDKKPSGEEEDASKDGEKDAPKEGEKEGEEPEDEEPEDEEPEDEKSEDKESENEKSEDEESDEESEGKEKSKKDKESDVKDTDSEKESIKAVRTTSAGGERGVAVDGRGDILWAVDMDDLTQFDLYTGPNQGTWSSEDGTIRIDGGNGNKAISKNQEFTDFVFEADVTVEKQADLGDKSSAQGGILFRASQGSDRVSDGYYGYYLCINAKGQEMVLGRSSGNNWYQIAARKMKVEFGKTYHLTVTCSGSHITCYADYDGTNYAKLYINDDTHASGGIGMRNWLSHASYRNLVVSEYEENLPSENSSYTNPLMNHCADPDVLYYNKTYFLYPTNAGDDGNGIKVYTSTDLVHWTDQGYAFTKGDGWGTSDFWAPDIIERDGTFYMYYVANEQICVATSTSPMGPFTQEVKEPMDPSEKNIDAHIFYDEASDKYYIYYVRFTGGNVIWGAELSDDMMSIKKDTLKQIVAADQGWDQDMGNINEGPFMLVHDGKYYLTYSGAHFQSINYGSAFAVSDSPLGDYTKYEYNPIMKSNATVHGTGHHGIVESPDGTELFMVYHSHHDLGSTEPRQLCIDRVHFTTDPEGNTILEVKGPTITPQDLPSGAVDVANFIEVAKIKDVRVADDAIAKDIMAALPKEITITTSKGAYTASVIWNDIADEDVKGKMMEAKGSVVLPEGVENLGDADLTATCNVNLGDAKVKAELIKGMESISIPSADAIRGNITLPEAIGDVELSWESDNEDVISSKAVSQDGYYDIPAGVVTRGSEDKEVKLTVTGNLDGVTAEREIAVTVLAKKDTDDFVGYLYAHFKEIPGQRGEQDIFYGISEDGLNWKSLNKNEAVLKSDVGDKATRDPYIIRSAEGDKFYLLATDQDIYKYGSNIPWDKLSTQGSTALTIWESTDLIHWENERNIDVAGSIGGGCAWAPEAVYDEGTGEYLVYWASKISADNYARQYTFVSRTRDFYTFTEPELFNDFGSNIDTSILKEGDSYYRLTKIEDGMYVRLDKATGHPRAYGDQVKTKKIGDLTFNVIGGNYSYIENTADGCLESFKGNYEGGTLFKFNDKEEWCIMLDEYGGLARGYIPFVTSDLDEPNSIKVLNEDEYTAQEGSKHGVILPVTQKEYDALVNTYGVDNSEKIAIKIEAERGVITSPAKAVSRGDASGGYKVGYIDNTEATITFTLKAPKAGTYRIEIAADGDKGAFPNSSHRYWVNGDESSAKIVKYDKATNWDVWSLYSVNVDLKEGKNTFTVSHSGRDNSFSELDYIIFHVIEDPEFEICLDGKPIDSFDPEKSLMNFDVDSLDDLPEVSVSFEEGTDESFKAEVTQASKDRPESYVTVYSEKDPSYEKKYTLRFTGPDSFQNLLVNFGADPYVTYHDGYYYYVRMGRNDKGIWVTKTNELSRIGKVEPVCVYMPSGDEPVNELWAPEIHFLDGKWYIHYTAGGGSNHRMRVLESVTDDAQGEYIYKGKMSPETDRWAIDMTVLELEDQLYAIWSGWDGFTDGEQRLYIARMSDPCTITGDRVELSKPEFSWETNEHPTINEGAQIAIAPDGTVNIVYSASGSWSDTYCLGCLTLKKGEDPMNKDSWIKATKPVFENNGNTTLSTGHASFVQSPDGKETFLVYHAIVFPGGGWNGRGVRAQRVYWNEDGTPFLGRAADYTDKINTPSGTKTVSYTRIEAEDAILTGLSRSSQFKYNASGNACVYNFADGKSAEFTFDIDEAGEYMLYLGASSGENNAALKVSVNGEDPTIKTIYNFNANSGGSLVPDNWFGYGVKVNFTEGTNTVVVSGVSGRGKAALDYIEFADYEEATAPQAAAQEPEEPETPEEPENPDQPDNPANEFDIPEGGYRFTKGSAEGLVIRCLRDIEGFTGLGVDGKELTKDKDYTVKKGSTLVTIAPDYLKNLAEGEHYAVFYYGANTPAEVKFNVLKEETAGDNQNNPDVPGGNTENPSGGNAKDNQSGEGDGGSSDGGSDNAESSSSDSPSISSTSEITAAPVGAVLGAARDNLEEQAAGGQTGAVLGARKNATGDATSILFRIIAIILSSLGIAVLLFPRKKGKKH